MKEFQGYVDPVLAQFLTYDGEDLSDTIGDDWKDVEVEPEKNEEGVYV